MAPLCHRGWLVLGTALVWTLALPLGARGEGEVCEAPPARGPVSLMILASGARVQELASSVHRGVAVVARDADTVIFADGRVLTADAASAGEHLNRLGWAHRPIRVVASFPAQRARPRRARG